MKRRLLHPLCLATAMSAACLSGCAEEGTQDRAAALDHRPGAPSGSAGRGGTSARPQAATGGLAAGCAPASTFSYALCVCEDLVQAGQITVGRGPSGDGSVGVNGRTQLANHLDVAGSWVSHGPWQAATGARLGGQLRTAKDATFAGSLVIGQDLAVGGDLRGAGRLEVGGALRVAGQDLAVGSKTIASSAAYRASEQPPCGCEPARRFDVKAAVAQAKGKNDNAARGLPTSLESVGASQMTLGAGRYYFGNVRAVGRARFVIDGAVAIFVDGDLETIGHGDIVLRPGATLDLYVSGAVRLVGYTPLGNPAAPASFRLYIGGGDRVSVAVGRNEFHGAIYAPTADVAFAGDTLVVGALFAKRLDATGRLRIDHGGAVPGGCGPAPGGGAAPTPTPNPPPTTTPPPTTPPPPAPTPPPTPAPEPEELIP
jgi:hypothetical protein